MQSINKNSHGFLSGWADGEWATSSQRRIALTLIALVILSLAILPLLPMLRGWFWPLTHDTYRYAVLLDHFSAAFREGVVFPRWLPDIMGGFGLPQFVFYQPGFFFLALPFDLLFDHPMMSSGLALLVMLCFGGAGAYNMCRRFAGPALALLGAGFFLLTPYAYVNVAVRGDWSELLACMITPWAISFLVGLRDDTMAGRMPLRSVIGLGLSLAAIAVSHPLVALFTAVMMCVLTAGIFFALMNERRFEALKLFSVNAGLAALLGLLVSAPYWWPVLAFQDMVNIDAAKQGYFTAANHVVYPSQFFSRAWGFGPSAAGLDDMMSFQLGFPHFVVALAGAAWAVRARRSVLFAVAFFFYLLLLVAMLPISGGLWSNSLFEIVQFPWRLLSITMVLQVLCLAGLAPLFKRLGHLSLPVAILLFVMSAGWYGNQFKAIPMFRDFSAANLQWLKDQDAASFISYSGSNEFLPRTALRITELEPQQNESKLSLYGDVIISADKSTPHRIMFQTGGKSGQGYVRIGQIYFPGWRVRVDGKEFPPEALASNITMHGLIMVPVPNGAHLVEAWYDGPPGWRWRLSLSLLALAGFPVLVVVLHRLDRSKKP